jgi:hypothetical protein
VADHDRMFEGVPPETLIELAMVANNGPEFLRRILIHEQVREQEKRSMDRLLWVVGLIGRTMLFAYCLSQAMNIWQHGIRSMEWFDWVWQYLIWSVFISWQKMYMDKPK